MAGFVVTGNEDGAHHCISQMAQGLIDVGWTVPAQAWTYWNKGPGPGPSYLETDEGHEWSATTGQTAAQNLVTVARALGGAAVPGAGELALRRGGTRGTPPRLGDRGDAL